MDKACCHFVGVSETSKIGYLVLTSLMVAGLIPLGIGWLVNTEYQVNPKLSARENEQRAHEAFYLRENYDACIIAGLTIILISLIAIMTLAAIETIINVIPRRKNIDSPTEKEALIEQQPDSKDYGT
ncbi:hypothetical protein Ciccas_003663 [Cichlidogyrus casuarinus]|uniref:Uncharacterized protein n=1 Tax=Cichlidogyrus casuarinus TaxID=1844966 RepID=A0ABD2QEI9_9PLAT